MLNKTEKRIHKVWDILFKRLPTGYCVPIKCYSTIYSMLRTEARELNWSYTHIVNWYNKHQTQLEKSKTGYINSKYKGTAVCNRKQDVFRITAFASYPIKIALDSVKKHTNKQIAFLLLHEFSHILYNDTLNEQECDMFAIRWTRKLIKEGLF